MESLHTVPSDIRLIVYTIDEKILLGFIGEEIVDKHWTRIYQNYS